MEWLIVGAVILAIVLILVALKALSGGGGDFGVSPHEEANLSFLPQRFVVFDLETTGLDPARHEIIEIGAIRVHRDSDVHDTFRTLIKPLKRVPKKITRMTGISQEMLDHEGEPLQRAITGFASFIGDLPLVSFNAEFDMAFLQSSAKRHNVVIANPASCALKMARRAWPGRQSYRLSDLARDGKLSDEGTHRAIGDCKRALIVYTAAASILQAGSASRRTGKAGNRQT
jgi:DNA polymerase III epsilon subunit family exonuclease